MMKSPEQHPVVFLELNQQKPMQRWSRQIEILEPILFGVFHEFVDLLFA